MSKFKKNLTRCWAEVEVFLNEQFIVSINTAENAAASLPVLNTEINILCDPPLSIPLRNYCENCAKTKDELQRMVKANRMLKQQLKMNNHRYRHLRSLKQALQRKEKIESNLCSKLRDLKKAKLRNSQVVHTSSLSKYVKKYKKLLTVHKQCKITQRRLQRKITDLEIMVEKLKLSNEELLCQLSDSKKTIMTKNDSKTYSTACRKAIYYCLQYGVPVTHVCDVINAILFELPGITVDSLPHSSTVSQCVYELGIISDIQVSEIMYANENLTLSWDSTTVDGTHINELHISVHTVPVTSYVLQLGAIASGRTEDYVSHISDSLNHMIAIYAKFKNLKFSDVRSTILKHFKNTLTDRVAVNHCVVQHLQSQMDVELLELNCNVHPLDGIAKKCTSILKNYDAEMVIKSDTFGRDCCVVNLIYGITKMRYKQGKGDPAGFKNFLRQEGIKLSMIPRFVGNRFHIVFHLAGVIFYLRDKLILYLETMCRNSTTLHLALLNDLKNKHILLQLQALGLLGKVVTGPWIQQLYDCSTITNLEVTPYINTCLNNLKKLTTLPLLMLEVSEDVFGATLDRETDDVMCSLIKHECNESEKDILNDILSRLLAGMILVIEKQLNEYIQGSLSNLSPSKIVQTCSAPVHNMFAEQTLGLADHYLRRARNCTIGFIDGKVKSRKNDSLTWLVSKPSDEQKSIIVFSIAEAKKMRTHLAKRQDSISKIQDQIATEKRQKKDSSYRRKLEKKLNLVLNNNADLSAVLPELSIKQTEIVRTVLSNMSVLNGFYIEHLWFTEQMQNILYHGHIISVKITGKVPKATICYWTNEATEEEGEDEKICILHLLTDYIAGDMVFVDFPNL